jgi:dimethylamine monooxygenase subunit A
LDSPQRAAALHDALASMSPAVLDYRSLGPVRDALLAWLQRRAAG